MSAPDPTKSDHQYTSSCHRPLSRASRQLFRQDASPILLHYFGGKGRNAPWRLNDGDAALPSSDSSIDPTTTISDKQKRKREWISLVDNPDDGLTDREWYDLLRWALDTSTSMVNTEIEIPICPLHPKHDILLRSDQNSFLLHRRHRTRVSEFGAFSLPSGRAARAAFWLEEREQFNQGRPVIKKSRYMTGKVTFLFQCGICGKTFMSRYYLDKHMEAHHPPHNGTEVDSAGYHSLCPADHVCEALGGSAACVEVMNQISPYYGRGILTGREYVSSLISSQTERIDNFLLTTNKRQMQTLQALNEANFRNVMGEIRHRSLRRNKLMLQAALHRQQKQGKNSTEEEPNVSENVNNAISRVESNSEDTLTSSDCDEREMKRLFCLCQDMMQTCFGDSFSNISSGHTSNLTKDLITHLCEPLHCHHRLHRMAGHNRRHALHWNDQWDAHHSFTLGLYGWIVVLGVIAFYGCAFGNSNFLGGGIFGNSNLPSHGRHKKKKRI